MNEDKYFYLPYAFKPSDIEATIENQVGTRFPRFNSQNYATKLFENLQPVDDYLPVYSHLEALNGDFFVCSNDFTSCITQGELVGTTKFNSLVQRDISESFVRTPVSSVFTSLKPLSSNLILVTLKSGSIQLWNKKFGFGGERFSAGFVTTVDKKCDREEFVIGTSIGGIHVFDYELAELAMDRENPNAHTRAITGVSCHPTKPKLLTTCSSDKTCVLWDLCSLKPTLKLYKDPENHLKAVHWANERNLVMIGDEVGNLLTIDSRMPQKILNKTEVSNRTIRKLCFNGSKKFGVVSESNSVKIINIDDCSTAYKHRADKIIYDMCWDENDETTFYVVGEGFYAEQVRMVSN